MSTPGNGAPGNCAVCQRLSGEYESATLEWFRVQAQLRLAEFSRAEESSNRIIAELSRIAARRNALREAIEEHNNEYHPRVATATGNFET